MSTTRAPAAEGINWNRALGSIPFSPIRRMFNKAATMQDVVHLSIGQPDFATPAHIIDAHIRALQEGKTRYELDAGLPALRDAIAAFYSGRYGIDLSAENVLVTTGCCQAMFMALTAATRPGMEVIVIEPVFVLACLAEMAGATLKRIVTTADNGYQVDPQQVIDAISDRTCAIMLNSPGNPTGAVYPAETIEPICRAAAERGIALISDEVYDRLILDEPYASALPLSPSLDHLIMASSVSKTYAMPGLRVGWAISSEKNIETLQRLHMFISTTENTAGQWAVLEAFTAGQSCVEDMVSEYRRRRDRIAGLVEQAPHMTGYRPGGAFFITPSLPAGTDSFELAMRMLDEVGVCTVPGGTFGQSCNNALRLSYSTSMQEIDKAFERMIPWLGRQSF